MAYSRTGASGRHFAALIEQLGIADGVNERAVVERAVVERAVVVPAGFTAECLVRGELDLTDLTLHRGTRPAMPARITSLATSVVAFALGCGAAALLCAVIGLRSFVVPPLLAFSGRRQVCHGERPVDGDLGTSAEPSHP